MTPSLDLYRHARIVVQNEWTSAREAALAMRKNDVGCVLVTEGRRLVGIVTDRDLAVRVVSVGRDPATATLHEIMSSPVTTLDVSAPHEEAIRIMRERRVRRVPLVEGVRVVGMVTFDDLLLERSASFEDLVAIVRTQLVEGGPARTRRFDEWTALARRHSRAVDTKVKLLAAIGESARLRSDEAERALVIVLDALLCSVDEDVRRRLIARLPVAFRAELRERSSQGRGATSTKELAARVARDLGVDAKRAAAIVGAIGPALGRFVRASDPIGRRLPRELRELLEARPRRRGRAEPHAGGITI